MARDAAHAEPREVGERLGELAQEMRDQERVDALVDKDDPAEGVRGERVCPQDFDERLEPAQGAVSEGSRRKAGRTDFGERFLIVGFDLCIWTSLQRAKWSAFP